MKKALSVFLIAIFSLLLVSCDSSKKKGEGQIINYVLDSEPTTLDPQIAVDYQAEILIMNIFEGLTRIDPNQQAIPGVAESWETNEQKTQYTFHLRKDSVWSDEDKTALTAHDFVFGITRAIMSQTEYEKAENLFCIKNAREINLGTKSVQSLGVSAKDDYTLVIELESSYEDFARIVATPPFMPCNQQFFESTSGQYGRESDKILSNGPFKIKNKRAWIHDQKIQIILNESYSGPNKPSCAGVMFSIKQNISHPVSMINSEEIDATPITGEDLPDAKKYDLNLVSFKDITWGLCFNFKDDFFKHDQFRQAFIQSINREYVLSAIPENCSKTDDIILDSSELDGINYRNSVDQVSLHTYDPEKSQDTFKNLSKSLKLQKTPAITILCLDEPKVKNLVSRIIENWNNTFGIYVNMKPVAPKDLEKNVSTGKYEVAIYSIKATSNNPFDFLSVFKSDNQDNFVNFQNQAYDSLLKKANLKTSVQKKIDSIFSLESMLVEKNVFYPLYNESRYFVSSKDVTNILFHPYDCGIDFSFAEK